MATSGVGILVQQKDEQNMRKIDYVSDKILSITLLFDHPPHIIVVYAPDINKSGVISTNVYEKLQQKLVKVPENDNIMILGDKNARIGNEVVDRIKQKFNEKVIIRNREIMSEFFTLEELKINNTYPIKIVHSFIIIFKTLD